MSARAAVAVFVKTPELSPVKTRLAKDIGSSEAIRAYERCLLYVESRLSQLSKQLAGRVDVYWAVAESTALDSNRWASFPKISQGEGTLGGRLHQVYSTLKNDYDAVLVMGADSPLFPVAELAAGVEWLLARGERALVGPTEDGGYYVFGCREALEEHVWTSVAYSQSSTLSEFLGKVPQSLELKEMSEHWDLDSGRDLERLLKLQPKFFEEICL